MLAAKGHPGAQALATYWVGQGVGLMNKEMPARDVVVAFIEDYLAATERLSNSLPE
jgi:NAD(P)H-dependent flavin oxidoreductase YrpB (nitropropane dioxygenase family)